MSDDQQAQVEDENTGLWREVWDQQVGRRPILQAGLASAAALGLGGMVGAADADADAGSKRGAAPLAVVDLQFAYGHVHGVTGFTCVANGHRFRIARHTKASRAALRKRGGLWAQMDLAVLSHYAPGVQLPAGRPSLVTVYGRRGTRQVVVGQMFHAPTAAVMAEARKVLRNKGAVLGSPHRLKALGLTPAHVRTPRAAVQLASIGDSYTAATALVGCHPNIATKNSTNFTTTQTLLNANSAVNTLGGYIAKMQNAGHDYATQPAAKNPDGTPAKINVPVVQNDKVVGYELAGFTTFQLNQNDKTFPLVTQNARSALISAIGNVRNTASLGAVIDSPLEQNPSASTQTWVQPQGLIPQSLSVADARKKAGPGLSIQVTNPGDDVFGTKTEVNGDYNNGQVPLKLYNNWVRWVWVYVQYLGPNNENLSANPSPKWPDTEYSQSLGLLPQVFTLLGIPLWGTNSITVNLDFPENAHTARLLFCGLGSDINGGGWRQYFPADAYPGLIAPQDEVLFPALITGILTIGLTAFAIATDFDIATTWDLVRKQITGQLEVVEEALQSTLSSTAILTALETVAVSVAAGGEKYESISANGGSTENVWSLLLPLASAIPKLLFSPKLAQVWLGLVGVTIGAEVKDKLLQAIPFIGEAIAAIELAGDIVTLAEVCAETIVAPWVIENQVNLTYPATVTISPDQTFGSNATFPVEAVSWQLEAKVDGAVVLAPVTGQVNQGGHIRSDPLVEDVTAPFGGSEIQWSVVFKDATGAQVGTGMSDPLPNDDPNNPPSTVAFAIKNIEIVIDSTTVFERKDTTGYSPTAGGYTWSDAITATGTVLNAGIQQVTGAAVSTLAGAAGVVWEENNLYYLRGVTVAENGNTITLAPASHEGYARRPFLLYDAFAKLTDQGKHVLLEPDPNTPAYHVRQVTLDPTSGAPTWDSTISYGTFTLPVSAAALHSSGRIVTIHTDTGRLGTLLPVNTPRALSAGYTAGAGSQIGLLSSPIAIAVTNPGIVLVLDDATNQISAFDLNGNPSPYFLNLTRRSLFTPSRQLATGPEPYGIALATPGTYLDLAVDGANQMYTLYYTGDGSNPSDYHVDVYNHAGVPIDTNSPGVNVPKIAVDYWRSIYAGNYSALADTTTGRPHTDPNLGVVEPSISRFDPINTSKTSKPPRRQRAKAKRPDKLTRRG